MAGVLLFVSAVLVLLLPKKTLALGKQ
jgi:hypothetical protein